MKSTKQDHTQSEVNLKGNFTLIPNWIARSPDFDPYVKLIFNLIASCIPAHSCKPAYPSYTALKKWSGMCREKICSSLKVLETAGIIKRFKSGRSVYYLPYYISNGEEVVDMPRISFSTSSPRRLIGAAEPVRHVDYTSSPHELIPVRHVDSINTKEKEQEKEKQKSLNFVPSENGNWDGVEPNEDMRALLRKAVHG